MQKAMTLKGDIVAGAALAALGAYVLVTAMQWTFLAPDGPGPGFFPTCYGVLLLAGSLALIATSLRTGATSAEGPTDWVGVGRALGMWAVFVLMIPVMSYLGFGIGVALLIVFFTRVVFPSSWMFTVICAVLAPILFYLVFPLTLQVALPVGQWTGF